MDTGLAGRSALVLGSTSGLGLAVARGLAAEGARVAVCGRRAELAEQLAAALPDGVALAVDLADPGAAADLVARATEALGPLDVLVLNGGGPPPSPAQALTADALAPSLETLLLQQMRLVEQVLPGMRERGWGRLVAIGSSGVQQPLEMLSASNVGRAALAGYLKTLAAEVAPDGVTVNMVLPGRIDTDRVGALDQGAAERAGTDVAAARAKAEATIPTGRYGKPEEFAAAVVFLCSAAASYVTGEQLRCDGGLVRSY